MEKVRVLFFVAQVNRHNLIYIFLRVFDWYRWWSFDQAASRWPLTISSGVVFWPFWWSTIFWVSKTNILEPGNWLMFFFQSWSLNKNGSPRNWWLTKHDVDLLVFHRFPGNNFNKWWEKLNGSWAIHILAIPSLIGYQTPTSNPYHWHLCLVYLPRQMVGFNGSVFQG